jgi:DNA-binding response OmpR family regulator
MRILIVEDDILLGEMLNEALTELHHVVDVVQDGESAWDWLHILDYKLIVLDITLPKLDGISLCQKLRQHQFSLPILMLTARDTLSDKVKGLEAGADDYLVKPFEMPELIARIRSLLRRSNSGLLPDISWGDLRLNSSTYEVSYGEQTLHLTPKEYAILEILVSGGRRVLSRGGIIEQAWSLEDPPTEETVKSHIKSLRGKLREAGAPENFIETVHGLGYRMQQV